MSDFFLSPTPALFSPESIGGLTVQLHFFWNFVFDKEKGIKKNKLFTEISTSNTGANLLFWTKSNFLCAYFTAGAFIFLFVCTGSLIIVNYAVSCYFIFVQCKFGIENKSKIFMYIFM